jgi:hypothetical protein
MSSRTADRRLVHPLFSWKGTVCVPLAAFLLYNPFLCLVHTGAGLSLQHPVSKRATVASSELQHFPPVSGRISPDALSSDCVDHSWVDAFGEAFQSVINVDKDRLTPAELSANLWFRPPPTA